MIQTLWEMRWMILYLIGAAVTVGSLALWACRKFEDADEWLFDGRED